MIFIIFFSFCGVLLLMWQFSEEIFVFPQEGREGGPTGSVYYLQKNCRGEIKVMAPSWAEQNPGEWEAYGDGLMRSLPQGSVWSNLWCYPLTSWFKVSMTLCSETAGFITLWANDSNLSLNGTPTAWVLLAQPVACVWLTVCCLASQRYDLDFALGRRHCRRFWLFGSKNL